MSEVGREPWWQRSYNAIGRSPASSGPALSAALLDLIMLAHAGGRERTEAEFTQLLDHAGLRLVGKTPLAVGPHVLEAVAV